MQNPALLFGTRVFAVVDIDVGILWKFKIYQCLTTYTEVEMLHNLLAQFCVESTFPFKISI